MDFYNYPPGKRLNPFQPSNGDQYFVYSKLFSYLGNYEEIGNISWPTDKRNHFFFGEWVINIFKRFAIMKDGKIIFRNDNFDDGHRIGASRLNNIQYAILTNQLQEYKIPSWGTHVLKTYSIRDDRNPLQLKLFLTTTDAVKYAILISKKQHMTSIVAQWFADIDTH